MSRPNDEILTRLDSSRWSRAHSLIFASTSLGLLIWGYEAALGIASFFLFNRSLLFLVGWYAMDFVGDLIIPRLSDLGLARKRAFYLTMSLMGVGLTVLTADIMLYTFGYIGGLLPIIIGLLGGAIAKVGIEGDVPVSLSFLAENTPARYREASLVLAPNFNNIGSAVAAAIAYATYKLTTSAAYTALAVLVASLATLVALAAVREAMPESVRWLLTKGFSDRASSEASKLTSGEAAANVKVVEPTVGLWSRYTFLAIIGVSQYLTFGLMAYVIAVYYYSGAASWLIVFYASLGASVAAFPAYLLARKLDTRTFTAISYIGGLVSMIPILLFVLYFPTNMALFYALLFINMVFSEFGWAVRTILEPQLFPTDRRATMVGLIRMWPMLAYDVSVYVTAAFGEVQYVLFNVAFWTLGAAASVYWLDRGYDVRNALLESISSTRPLAGGSSRAPAVMAAERR